MLCLVAQSCLTLCDPMDCSPPGSSVCGILQARILEWVAMSSSRGSPQPKDQTQVPCIAGGFFAVWATREALGSLSYLQPFIIVFVFICLLVCLFVCFGLLLARVSFCGLQWSSASSPSYHESSYSVFSVPSSKCLGFVYSLPYPNADAGFCLNEAVL